MAWWRVSAGGEACAGRRVRVSGLGVAVGFRVTAAAVAVGALVAAGCQRSPAGGPEAAFERLAVAVAASDARLVYDALDTESRWAVDAVFQYHRDIGALAERRFPPEARERELARVAAARGASSAAEFFARQTVVAPLARLPDAMALGKLARVDRRNDGGATIVTTTGVVLEFAPGPDGRWGFAGFRDELVRWRDVAANDWKRLEEEAALLPPPR